MADQASQSGSWRRLGSLARGAAAEPVASDVHARGRMLVVAAAAAERRESKRRFRMSHAALIGGALVAASALLVYWQTSPLRYEVYGGQRFGSNYVGALASAPAHVKFSDGTEVDARPGSRLRIDETHRDGASVIVERGTATARVRHRDRSRWLFAAGPFNVKVIGTKFDLDWDPQTQVVSLSLHEGAVEVESPVGQSHCVVRAGQRFQASLQTGRMTLERIAPEPERSVASAAANTAAAAAEPSAAISSSESSPAKARAASARGRTSKAKVHVTPSSWAKLVRHGDFEAVVEQALAGDVDATLRTCSAAEARALADAARYTDRVPLAEQALHAIRARFSGSDQSQAAAFLLGRTSETRAKPELADRWYGQYLNESDDGKYTADALAGRMRALLAMSKSSAAREVAREYLRKFPEGVHLPMARRLSGEP